MHMRQVLQRVIKGDYRIPPGMPVSSACRDLLARILVVNPSERIAIQGIQQHPWCGAAFPLLPSLQLPLMGMHAVAAVPLPLLLSGLSHSGRQEFAMRGQQRRACPWAGCWGNTAAHEGGDCLHACRYLQDLPAGLSTFNDTCLAQQHGHQTVLQNVEHVRRIVQVRCALSSNLIVLSRPRMQLFPCIYEWRQQGGIRASEHPCHMACGRRQRCRLRR